MSVYECPKCGKKYEVDDECCDEEMEREGNKLTCIVCKDEIDIPSCCGEEMVKVSPEEEQQEENEE
jgi:hypothetical protein